MMGEYERGERAANEDEILTTRFELSYFCWFVAYS